ncbi:MAG: hypothetical protein HYT87_12720 [Nitrospirae bacterium]|nr:hypothetical protein [Nitrospirota bacterium]
MKTPRPLRFAPAPSGDGDRKGMRIGTGTTIGFAMGSLRRILLVSFGLATAFLVLVAPVPPAHAEPFATDYGRTPDKRPPWYGSGSASGDTDLRTFNLHWAPDQPPSNTELFRLQMPGVHMNGCQFDVNNFIVQHANVDQLRQVVSSLPATAGFASLYLMKHLPKVGSTIDELQRIGAMVASFQMADCQQMAQFAALKLSQETQGSSSPFLKDYNKRLECVARKGQAADAGGCSDPSALEDWWKKLGIPGAFTADQAMEKIAGNVWANWGRKLWPMQSSIEAGQTTSTPIGDKTRELRRCLKEEVTRTVDRIAANPSIVGPDGARAELEKLYSVPGGRSGLSLTVYGTTKTFGSDTPLMPGGVCDGAFADARQIPLGSLTYYGAALCRANAETHNDEFDRLCFLAKDIVAEHLANFVVLRRTQAVLTAANRAHIFPEAAGQSVPNDTLQLQTGAKEELRALIQTVQTDLGVLEGNVGKLSDYHDIFRQALVELLNEVAAYERTKKAWVIEQVRYGAIRPVDVLLEAGAQPPPSVLAKHP